MIPEKTVWEKRRYSFKGIGAFLTAGMLAFLMGVHPPIDTGTVTEQDTASPTAPDAGEQSLFDMDQREPGPMTLPESSDTGTLLPIAVSVCGAVIRPAVYRFEEDRRVQNAIDAAGGLRTDADLEDINIAARLMDNTTLYIPFKLFTQRNGHQLVARRTATAAEMNPGRYTRSGWTDIPYAEGTKPEHDAQSTSQVPPSDPKPAPANGRINLNSASLEELQDLPGIGPKTAEKIVAYREDRPFQRIEDLMEVHGIGDKKMEAVRDLVTFE